jgi:hypothetical protein
MNFRVVLASLFFLQPLAAFAQSDDPVDRNIGGGYAGLALNLGQAHGVGADGNGTSYLMGADIGYVLPRDTWNRIEFGLELSTGKAEYDLKLSNQDADVDINFGLVALAKVGYGYSLGGHAFGMLRLGFGIANGDADVSSPALKAAGLSADQGDFDGTVAMIGYDAVFPATSNLDFLVGINYRIYTLDFDDAATDGNAQVNVTSVNAAARFRF